MANPLVRIPRTASPTLVRAAYMSELSPFAAANDKGFGIVRGTDPAQHRAQGETLRRQGFEKNPVVNACARVIADQVGVATLESYSIEEDGRTVLHPKDELQELLDQPGPQMAGFTFRRMSALQLSIYGNSYWATKRKNGMIVSLRNVHPERMAQVTIGADDLITKYHWRDSSGRETTTPAEHMLHIRDHIIDPDGWFGFPRGLSALIEMVTDGEASHYVRQILANSGVPSIVFFGRQGAGDESLRNAEMRWQERMVHQGARGSARFLAGIESMQVIGHSLKDLEFPSLRTVTREGICAAFGVDPRLIAVTSAKGAEGGLSGSQYQEARRRLEQQTCQPIRLSIQESMDTTITPHFGYKYVRFSPNAIAAIIETPTEVAQRTAILVASAITTLDEARVVNGLSEKMNPQHVTNAPMLQTVQEALEANTREAEQQKELAAAKTASKVNKEVSPSEQANGPDGITDKNNGRSQAPNAPVTRQSAPPSRLRISGAADLTSDEESEAWAAFDARARALEPMLFDAAQDAIADTVESILHTLNLATDADSTRASNDPWWDRFFGGLIALFNANGPIRRLWLRMFASRMQRSAEEIAEQFALELGKEFDAGDPRFVAGLRRRFDTLSRSVSETLAKRVQELVRVARAADMPADEVARLVRTHDFSAISRRIAQTESVGLLNHAEMMAAEQLGGIKRKRWLSQRDNKVRHSHALCDGAGWIPMGQAFPNGLQYPHDPNGSADEVDNCRCATMYSDIEDVA